MDVLKKANKSLKLRNKVSKRHASELACEIESSEERASELEKMTKILENTEDLEIECKTADDILKHVKQARDKCAKRVQQLEHLNKRERKTNQHLMEQLNEALSRVAELKLCINFREKNLRSLQQELTKLRSKSQAPKLRNAFSDCVPQTKKRSLDDAMEVCEKARKIVDNQAEMEIKFTVEGSGGTTFSLRGDDDGVEEKSIYSPEKPIKQKDINDISFRTRARDMLRAKMKHKTFWHAYRAQTKTDPKRCVNAHRTKS